MPDIDSTVQHDGGRSVGVGVVRLATYFTTDGSGVPTLGFDHGGAVSVSGTGSPITVTVPSGRKMTVQITEHGDSDLSSYTVDESTGAIVLTFSADFDNGRCDIQVTYHNSEVE